MSFSEHQAEGLQVAAVSVLILAGVLGSPADAAAIRVTTTSDEVNASPPCSLREAIRSANGDAPIGGCAAGSGADTINLPAGVYRLGIPNSADPDENLALTGDLDVVSNLTLVGSGEAATIIDGSGAVLTDRVFDISATGMATFKGLTIRNGNTPTSAAGGGAVSNGGRARFSNTTIVGNTAGTGGGAVSNGAGAISEFFDSTISGNAAGGSGAGVRIGSGASSTFTNTTINGNTAQVGGGGVSNDGVATFTNSTVSGNAAANDGGGIFNSTVSTSTIVNSTISGNRSSLSGGGLHGGTTSLFNSTVTANVADSDVNGVGDGGGVALTMLTMKNSIIAANTDVSSPPTPVAPDCQAVVMSQGYSLIGNSTGCTITAGSGDMIGTGAAPLDPGLAPLGNSGGPTATHALLASSPARNAGSPAAPGTGGHSCTGADQRAVPRPQDSRCDMGAYEYAVCLKAVVNRVGTPGNDTLAGTSGPDVFLGLGGKDRIKGRAGKDRACGGRGSDPIIGGSGADRLAGNEGADRLFGGIGADRLVGGRGNDVLLGGKGRDRCVGGPGRDRAVSCEKKVGIA